MNSLQLFQLFILTQGFGMNYADFVNALKAESIPRTQLAPYLQQLVEL